jgi:hypothetical protein
MGNALAFQHLHRGSKDLQIIAERIAYAKFTHVASADLQKPVF